MSIFFRDPWCRATGGDKGFGLSFCWGQNNELEVIWLGIYPEHGWTFSLFNRWLHYENLAGV